MTSTAIYTCYRQLHPPTGVDHAVFGSITAPGARDLVVAKASIIELYRVHRDGGDPKERNDTSRKEAAASFRGYTRAANDGGVDGVDELDDDASNFYLELAGTFPLAGNITSLATIPTASSHGSEGVDAAGAPVAASLSARPLPSLSSPPSETVGDDDAFAASAAAAVDGMPDVASTQRQQQQRIDTRQDILAVSFGYAKVTLVAYDSLLGRLTNLSIHNFDPDAIGPGSGGVESGYGLASALKDRPPTLSASDPAGRCLAAVVAGCQLVVLPTLRHVPRSVFLSREARERAARAMRAIRRRRLRRRRRRRREKRRRRGTAAATEATAEGENGVLDGDEIVDAARLADAAADGRPRANGATVGANGSGTFHHRDGDNVDGDQDQDGDDDQDDYVDDGDDGDNDSRDEEEGEDSSALAGGGGSREDGARWVVSKPFTIDLEEVGITG